MPFSAVASANMDRASEMGLDCASDRTSLRAATCGEKAGGGQADDEGTAADVRSLHTTPPSGLGLCHLVADRFEDPLCGFLAGSPQTFGRIDGRIGDDLAGGQLGLPSPPLPSPADAALSRGTRRSVRRCRRACGGARKETHGRPLELRHRDLAEQRPDLGGGPALPGCGASAADGRCGRADSCRAPPQWPRSKSLQLA